MHEVVQRLVRIENQIKEEITKLDTKNLNPQILKIIAIGKTFPLDAIMPLIEHGHLHFGENKVQEAMSKWRNMKKNRSEIKSLKQNFISRFNIYCCHFI